jgi:dUTP pyrophosphatase
MRLVVRTDIAVAIPSGYVGLIKDRSGLESKQGITVLGGIIVENFRGELCVILHNTGSQNYYFSVGDRIAQLVIVPICPFEAIEVDELPSNLYRGEAGFGSSGK